MRLIELHSNNYISRWFKEFLVLSNCYDIVVCPVIGVFRLPGRQDYKFIRFSLKFLHFIAKDIAYLHFSDGLTSATTLNNQKLIVHIDAIKKITTYYNSWLVIQLFPVMHTEAVFLMAILLIS